MPTSAQINANRANAARSTGPITQQGKHTASQNALKHGLFSRLLPNEEEFQQTLQGIMADLEPSGAIEQLVVEQIALAYFRLGHLYRVENDARSLPDPLTNEMSSLQAPAKSWFEGAGAPLMIRYEAMLNRQIQRSFEFLQKLQQQRRYRQARKETIAERERAQALQLQREKRTSKSHRTRPAQSPPDLGAGGPGAQQNKKSTTVSDADIDAAMAQLVPGVGPHAALTDVVQNIKLAKNPAASEDDQASYLANAVRAFNRAVRPVAMPNTPDELIPPPEIGFVSQKNK